MCCGGADAAVGTSHCRKANEAVDKLRTKLKETQDEMTRLQN